MVRFLISAAFSGAAFIRDQCLLLQGDIYSDLSASGAVIVRGWCLFQT